MLQHGTYPNTFRTGCWLALATVAMGLLLEGLAVAQDVARPSASGTQAIPARFDPPPLITAFPALSGAARVLDQTTRTWPRRAREPKRICFAPSSTIVKPMPR